MTRSEFRVPCILQVRTLAGHSGGVSTLAFSQDDNLVVSGSGDCSVKIWDAATGTEVSSHGGRTFVTQGFGLCFQEKMPRREAFACSDCGL